MTTSLDASYDFCKSLTQRTAGNFYYAFLTLPSAGFRDMCVLYAFMRVSDDIGDDEQVPINDRIQQLEHWKQSLECALSGSTDAHPLFPALADVVSRHAVPHEYLFSLIEGVRRDLDGVQFESFAELSDYCYHVAGVVGLCCIQLWGYEDPRAHDAAIDCGLAFQLTNILRDLGEDARAGRVYLPAEDLRSFEYSADDLLHSRRNAQFGKLMRFEVDRARQYFRRGEELLDYISPQGRPILSAMLRIYGGLLSEIERRDFDVFSRRVRLASWRKAWISLDETVRHRWFAPTSDR